jgi:hypothetical protein
MNTDFPEAESRWPEDDKGVNKGGDKVGDKVLTTGY